MILKSISFYSIFRIFIWHNRQKWEKRKYLNGIHRNLVAKAKERPSKPFKLWKKYNFSFIYSKSNGVHKMAKLISGLAIAKEIRQELKQHIIEWEIEGHRAPHLTAVLIGDDPASHTYVNNKIKVCISHFHFLQRCHIWQHYPFLCYLTFLVHFLTGSGWSWNIQWNKTVCINNHWNRIARFDQRTKWRR